MVRGEEAEAGVAEVPFRAQGRAPGRAGRMSALFLLYFVQGMPYGFQEKLLPALLRKGGQSYTQLSLLKLLLVPWLCKPAWAPLVSSYRSQRWWLLTSMGSMTACCFLSAAIPPSNLWALGCCLLFLNMASATQDIAVDSLAISVLPPQELGMGNTVQVVGYKAGIFFAGGILLWMQLQMGWASMFVMFGTAYLLAILCTTLLKIVRQVGSNHHPGNGFIQSYQKVLKVPGTRWLVLYLLLYKLGERGCLANFPLFLLDSGVSIETVGWWNGFVAQAASVAGSVYGGQLGTAEKMSANLIGPSKQRCLAILVQHAFIFLVSATATPLQSNQWLLWGCALSHVYLSFVSGAITTATFTMIMAHSQGQAPPDIQGTHYAMFSALEVSGKLLFVSLIGPLLDGAGFFLAYFLFFTLSVLVLPVLHWHPGLFPNKLR